MRPVPFTRIAGILPAVRILESAGAPVDRIARCAGVSTWLFDAPDAVIPLQLGCRLYHLAARALGQRFIGATIGRQVESWELGAFGALLSRSTTVYEGLRTSVAYLPLFASGHRDWLVEEPDRVWLCQDLAPEIDTGRRQVQAFTLMMTIQTFRSVVGRDWLPERIQVADHGRAWVESLELGIPIDVDPRQTHAAIAIPRRWMPFPVHREAPPEGAALLHRLAETAAPSDFVGSLRVAIRSLLTEESPHVELIAEAACLSARTLQRRLADAGLTFSRLLDQCRLEKARELLAEPGRRAIDVAYELGYHDPGNFTRAFRRWAGVTPRQFHQRSQLEP